MNFLLKIIFNFIKSIVKFSHLDFQHFYSLNRKPITFWCTNKKYTPDIHSVPSFGSYKNQQFPFLIWLLETLEWKSFLCIDRRRNERQADSFSRWKCFVRYTMTFKIFQDFFLAREFLYTKKINLHKMMFQVWIQRCHHFLSFIKGKVQFINEADKSRMTK